MPWKSQKYGECLSAREASKLLGVSRATLATWRRRSIGPPYLREPRKRTSPVFYPKAALLAWNECRLVLHKPAD